MSDHSLIQWTDATWLFWPGCVPKSAGCLHCYAVKDAWRLAYNPHPAVRAAYGHIAKKVLEDGTVILGGDEHPRRDESGVLKFTGIVRFLPGKLGMPLQWRDPRKIFVSANSDLFLPARMTDEAMPQIAASFGVMTAAKQHTFQVLTKWPENTRKFMAWLKARPTLESEFCTSQARSVVLDRRKSGRVPAAAKLLDRGATRAWPPRNIWLGASVENRAAKSRIDELRKLDVALRFLSIEPQLEDLGELDLTGIGWVICGGESGAEARPCAIEWLESIVAQCRAQNVPVFVKQLGRHPVSAGNVIQLRSIKGGDIGEWPEHLRIREMCTRTALRASKCGAPTL